MQTILSTWHFDKTVAQTSYAAHSSETYPIEPKFTAPPEPSAEVLTLTFGMEALMASIGRTSTLNGASTALMQAKGLSAMVELNALVKDQVAFELTTDIQSLVDAERSHFAGQVAAGVVDLAMSSMGYAWRDGAHILAKKLDPHADFIYGGGRAEGLGVVLAESHGSFKDMATKSYVSSRGKTKYTRQVKPYLAKTCVHGKIIHGYSIAFGSKPGYPGSFLHISETAGEAEETAAFLPDQSENVASIDDVEVAIGLSTHRSNFGLMGASPVVQWIDWLTEKGPLPAADAVDFLTVRYAGRNYVLFADLDRQHPSFPVIPALMYDPQCWYSMIDPGFQNYARRGNCGWYAMEERCALSVLNALTQVISEGPLRLPQRVPLAVTEAVGFGWGARAVDRDRTYRFAQFPDGLALLGGPPPKTLVAHLRWDPRKGLEEVYRKR